jgi:hypothetical protein
VRGVNPCIKTTHSITSHHYGDAEPSSQTATALGPGIFIPDLQVREGQEHQAITPIPQTIRAPCLEKTGHRGRLVLDREKPCPLVPVAEAYCHALSP